MTLGLTVAHVHAQSRVAFLGDSITEAGAHPGGYVALVADTLAKSNPGTEVFGAGISGNKVPDLLERLGRDVLDHDPTHVVVYIGINDVWHDFEFEGVTGTPPDVFEQGLRELVQRIRAAGASPLLSTPSVIGEDPDSDAPVNERLEEYSDITRKVAASAGVPLLDLRAHMAKYLRAYNTDREYQGILTTDGVHLNAAGNRFVAEFMSAAVHSALDS